MKILCFAPYSAIWVHAFPEALILESLKQQNHQIKYIGCGGIYSKACIAMSAVGADQHSSLIKRQYVCSRCKKNKKIITEAFDFENDNLSSLITDEDKKKTDGILDSITESSIDELQVEGVFVGKIALYEFLLKHKKSALSFDSKEEWKEYRIGLENTLMTLFIGLRIFAKEHPERVILYNSLYSTNKVICELAKIQNIPYYFLHAGGNLDHRLQTLMMGREHTFSFLKKAISDWKQVQNKTLPHSVMKPVTDHYIELFKGQNNFAYSSEKQGNIDIRSHFNINTNKKILVATMSSYDERFAAESIGVLATHYPLVFSKQIDWVKALIDYVQNREDLFLVIRVHPREFPNKRDSVRSEHSRMLESVFREVPDNVAINWPTDNISLYDLAEVTDVFLNAWSSVGKEMTLLGIPVVIYSENLIHYPATLNYLGTTKQEYFNQIEQALKDGWSLERIKLSYRWHAWEFEIAPLNISQSFTNTEKRNNSFSSTLHRKFEKLLFPTKQQKLDCENRASTLDCSPQIEGAIHTATDACSHQKQHLDSISQDDEYDFLRTELGRLISALYGNVANRKVGNDLKAKLVHALNN